MFKIVKSGFLALAILPTGATAVELIGNAEAGRQKAQVCAACHGLDGNSVNPMWPKIAGQGERYFIAQLQAFKKGPKGPRQHPNAALMYPVVANLSDQDMADLATWFAGQKITLGVADDQLVKKGAAIYQGGNIDFGSAACMGCHGPAGKGNPAAGFPALSGQHATYVYTQLMAFHDGQRTGDPNAMMQHMVRKMSNDEMRAVAEYIQGLHE